MRLARDAQIGGWPVAKAKAALRSMGSVVNRERFVHKMGKQAARQGKSRQDAEDDAGRFWDALVAEALLVPHPDHPGTYYYQTSERALALAGATLGAGHSRAAAEKALAGFIERAKQLEDPNSKYPFRVGFALLFGSFAAGKEVVGDVDLWVKLVPRFNDDKEHDRAIKRFIETMEEEGCVVPGGIGQIFWPFEQTRKFLRNRSRILSFVSDDDSHLALALKGPHRVVYPPEGQALLDRAKKQVEDARPPTA